MATYRRDELLLDFELYAEKFLWIVDKNNAWLPFRLKSCQKRVLEAIARCLRRGLPPRVVILKARQMGFSTLVQGLLFRSAHLIGNYSSLVIAHKKESTQLLFDKSLKFYTKLPDRYRPKKRYMGKREMEFVTGSRIAVEVANEDGGRGITANGVHLSEAAYFPDLNAVLQAVLGGVPKTPNSLVVIESTPNGYNEFRDLYVAAKSGQSDFEAVFVPWFEEPEYRMDTPIAGDDLDEREMELVAKHGVDLHQLAWRRYVIRTELNRDAVRFEVEYPSDDVRCFTLTGSPVFAPEAITYYNTLVPPARPAELLPEPISIRLDENEKRPIVEQGHGELMVFTPTGEPIPRRLYIVSADPSEGDKGSDPSPIVVIDRHTLEPVAVWDGRARPDRLAKTASAIAMWFNGALLTWESNNHGLAFQIEVEKWYDHFYFRTTTEGSVARAVSDKPGWDNKSKTRDFAIDTLVRLVDNMMCPIYHPRLVAEMSTFYYTSTPGGKRKADHLRGKTSDLLFAYAIGLVAHRHDDDSTELAPLTEQEVATIVAEMHRIRMLESMGLDGDRPALMDRVNATAEELEQYDEMNHERQQARTRLGVGEAI